MNFASELYNRIEDLNLWEKTIVVERNGYLTAYGSVEKALLLVSGSLKVCMQDTLEDARKSQAYSANSILDIK